MAKVINCQCGYVIRGETDDEMVEGAEAHMRDRHPELAGTVSREEILSWVEDA